MKQNHTIKTKLSLVLMIATFLLVTLYSIASVYGGMAEVSAFADASSSFEELKPTPKVILTPEIEPTLGITPTPALDLQLTDLSLQLEDVNEQVDLPSNSIVVNDYAELTAALSEDNGYEIIYLDADIEAEQTGIAIHPSKPNVVIDGCPPDEENVRYTFSELPDVTDDPSENIHLSNGNNGTRNITFQNMIIKGQNSNGVIFIPDNLSNVTVHYQNVAYSGPQAVTNPRGLVHLVDSSFEMYLSDTAISQYVVTANRIELDGAINVTTSDLDAQILDAVFLPTYTNPQIDFLENAKVTITVKGYVLNVHTDSANIHIRQNASLNVTGKSGFTPLGENIKNIMIAENAFVSIIQNDPQTFGTLRIEETLEMLPGSTLIVTRFSPVGSPIIFPTNEGRAIFDNPERVIIYSPSLSSIDFENDGFIKIITSSINAWDMDMIPFQDPFHIWNDSDNKFLTIESTYHNGHPVNVIHSLGDNSPSTTALAVDTFDLAKIELLIFGRIDLSVDPVYTDSVAITGLTDSYEANHNVNVSADYEGLSEPTTPIPATNDGTFSIDIEPEKLNPLNPITVTASFNSLTRREVVFPKAPPTGVLAFSVAPEDIFFDKMPIISIPTTIPRANGELTFSVSDTRNYPSAWRVDVSILTPLTATLSDGREVVLHDALVFVDEEGIMTSLSDMSLPIYREDSLVAGDFDVVWSADEGILLNILPGNIYSNATYGTTIQWDLVDAP